MLGRIHETPPRAITLALVGVVTLAAALPWRVVAASETPTYVNVPVVPPPPPAPPAPPALPAAPALPAMAARAMAAPPTPRTPRTPSISSSNMNIVSVSDDAKNAFIYFGDGISVMTGNANDFSRAEAMRQGNGDFAWYRDGGKAWVLRDPGYLKRIHDAYARAAKQADVPQKTADRQERLDREQEALNEQMAKLSERQSELANRNQNAENPESAVAYAQGHAAIAREQAAIGQKMGDLARERGDIARELAEQNRQQSQLSTSANREVNQILAEAVRNHVAVETH